MDQGSREKSTLARYRKSQSSPEEKRKIYHAFNIFASSAVDELSSFQQDVIQERIWSKLPAGRLKKKRTRKLWVFRAGAAALIVLVITLGFLFDRGKQDIVELTDNQAERIDPGKTGATLALSDGTKVKLASVVNGQIASEAGVKVIKLADGQLIYDVLASARKDNTHTKLINTLTTANGETFTIILPDRSKVMMNAGSSLTYSPSLIVNGAREVTLTGEAYFEIIKDSEHPFVVNTPGQSATVLGTHFNIRAYSIDSEVRTTLAEGAIQLRSKLNPSDKIIMKPGQVVVQSPGEMRVLQANMREELAWLNNDFLFRKMKTENVMNEIARWYNVEVRYESQAIKLIELSGEISKSRSLTTVLERVGAATHLRFIVTGRTIFVEKK